MDVNKELNLTGATVFKPGAIINIEFEGGGKLKNKVDGKFTLPDGYVLEETTDTRNLIRRKKG